MNQISTTIDDYVWTEDDEVEDGDVVEGKRYTESEFNVSIEIREREAKRVEIFLDSIDQRKNRSCFVPPESCLDGAGYHQPEIHQQGCKLLRMRVTAGDGKLGEEKLRQFRDNERASHCAYHLPKIIHRSGCTECETYRIDATGKIYDQFKQIIGRGTRTFDGKDYFTIHDFVKAYELFNDEDWDGEPMEPAEPQRRERSEEDSSIVSEPPPEREYGERQKVIKITLADGKERQIQHMSQTTFWHPDGHPISAAQFVQNLFGDLPAFFHDESQLRSIWSEPDTRKNYWMD